MSDKVTIMTPEELGWSEVCRLGLLQSQRNGGEVVISGADMKLILARVVKEDRRQRAKLTGTINGFTDAEIALLEAALYGEFERSQTGTPEFLALFVKLRNERTESIKKRIERTIREA